MTAQGIVEGGIMNGRHVDLDLPSPPSKNHMSEKESKYIYSQPNLQHSQEAKKTTNSSLPGSGE